MKPDGAMVGEYPIPAANAGARCVTAWPDGRLFFTAFDGGFIGEIIPD
jgi:hypothetical protein